MTEYRCLCPQYHHRYCFSFGNRNWILESERIGFQLVIDHHVLDDKRTSVLHFIVSQICDTEKYIVWRDCSSNDWYHIWSQGISLAAIDFRAYLGKQLKRYLNQDMSSMKAPGRLHVRKYRHVHSPVSLAGNHITFDKYTLKQTTQTMYQVVYVARNMA